MRLTAPNPGRPRRGLAPSVIDAAGRRASAIDTAADGAVNAVAESGR